MGETIEIRLEIEPVPKGRPRISRSGHAFTPAKTRAAEKEIQAILRSRYPGKPLDGPLSVDVQFFLTKPKSVKRESPHVKPDLDNLAKLVLDSANDILWADDAQICVLNLEKSYARPYEKSCVLISVTPLRGGWDDVLD